jgi:hypothetical protein
LSDLEDRLRRLERRLLWQPSVEEYLDASSRERVRALRALAEVLAPHGFDGSYLFTNKTLRMLAEDTPELGRGTGRGWRRGTGRKALTVGPRQKGRRRGYS